jgi:photosystem II stability/assembly factor-like uncharacterized protein
MTLYKVCYADSNMGVAVGESGTILRTTDGGLTWNNHSIETETSFNDVSFCNAKNGLVVGGPRPSWLDIPGPGIVLSTTDGGDSWVTKYLFSGWGGFWGVQFLPESEPNVDIVVGFDNNWAGFILTSSDYGDHWVQSIVSSPLLYGICFADANNGWVVGAAGTILHTTNGGVTFVEEEKIDEIPTDYLLFQNYPNPFNPVTKIKYSIPSNLKREMVNALLKVYDILGNKIETLLNEEKPAGTYEVLWNAANLPSGVYFYQLRSGSFVETKKMILIR